MKNIITTDNFKQTQKFGKKTAQEIIQKSKKFLEKKGAVVVGLSGDLGAGKTTFLQGFAEGLGIKEKILSPTFVILKHFKIKNSVFSDFYHIDCYRISKPEDILEIGFEKIILENKNIVAIEWPEKIKKFLPRSFVKIKFKNVGFNKREIEK
jgi:tRNA threonylcarbamoyladenosine biosynthesis protein TsaE